jgi:hypothetical protein
MLGVDYDFRFVKTRVVLGFVGILCNCRFGDSIMVNIVEVFFEICLNQMTCFTNIRDLT